MVLENVFLNNAFKKKYVFTLTIIYSIISILLANFIFGSNSGIVSVMFLSMLLIPTLRFLIKKEKKVEYLEKKFSIHHLIKNNRNLFEIYFLIFFGIFFTYLSFTFLLPMLGFNVINMFKEQLFLDISLRGHAFNSSMFWSIISNNWIVLVVCFLLGLITNDGAIFFVAWNASAWGAIFGFRALNAGIVSGSDPWTFLFILLFIVIWHVMIEGSAYILAAISGSTISNNVISRTNQISRFLYYFVVVGLITFLLIILFQTKFILLNFAISLSLFLVWLYFMKLVFKDKKQELIFEYNYWLFVLAIALLIIGVLLETFVLSSSDILNRIYALSFSI